MNLAHAFDSQVGLPVIPNVRPTIFVIDPDNSVRDSLAIWIRHEGWQAETFESAREFLARPRPFVPSCLILALSLPGTRGLELQKQIARERPEMPIIVASEFGDVSTTVQAMKAGADDFLVKPFNYELLLTTVSQSLERGRMALDRELRMRDLRSCYASLTPREQQVMRLVVAGMLNKQVGGELGITEKTVKAHRGQVMQKMKAYSLADLVRMAADLQPAPLAIHFA